MLQSACLPRSLAFRSCSKSNTCRRTRASTVCSADLSDGAANCTGRREVVMRSINLGVLAALFNFGSAPRPTNLGVKDYGEVKTLGLCPATPNCISTADPGDDKHYVPGWTYAPEDGRRLKGKVPVSQAMQELVSVVSTTTPDKFTPEIIKQTDDYLYVEYTSPTFGFKDDVEFVFDPKNSTVEYRSASRIGDSDFDINRKRIRFIRKELEKKGWRSLGFS